ncbi:hypothetical protein [Pseudomonas viridiflava]|uniref:hypothetical protein n=1 Tax=Pseudomonas viridiflava TaxID=33069 RepID=UPI000F03160C|nr:hypothetical protein [Pseudomonas viridiflava]
MNQAKSKSQGVIAYELKLGQLSSDLSGVRAQLEHELLGLLSPADLVSLWKLRTVLDQAAGLIERSLAEGFTRVSEDMLDLVVQVERIVVHAQEQVDRLRT